MDVVFVMRIVKHGVEVHFVNTRNRAGAPPSGVTAQPTTPAALARSSDPVEQDPSRAQAAASRPIQAHSHGSGLGPRFLAPGG